MRSKNFLSSLADLKKLKILRSMYIFGVDKCPDPEEHMPISVRDKAKKTLPIENWLKEEGKRGEGGEERRERRMGEGGGRECRVRGRGKTAVRKQIWPTPVSPPLPRRVTEGAWGQRGRGMVRLFRMGKDN